jgi:hypothetical protein
MRAKIVTNIKHMPSTAAGGLTAIIGLVLANSDLLAQIAGIDPRWSKYATAVVSVASGLGLILGVGPKGQ